MAVRLTAVPDSTAIVKTYVVGSLLCIFFA